jgi:hypothetical protein
MQREGGVGWLLIHNLRSKWFACGILPAGGKNRKADIWPDGVLFFRYLTSETIS